MKSTLPLHFGVLLFLWTTLATFMSSATPSRAQAQAEAGDIEIIRAFSERHYYSTGSYVYWGTKLNGSAGSNYPSEGDYSQPTLDDYIGNFIYQFLQRQTSNTYRPLFYLMDDDVAGGKTWADVQKKIIRIPYGQNPTLPEKRRLIVDVLRRQRILATPLFFTNLQRRYAGFLYAYNGGPGNMPQAAARYDATAWVLEQGSSNFRYWGFLGMPFWTFYTRIETERGTMSVAPRLNGFRFIPVMRTFPDTLTASDPDYPNIVTALKARGFDFSLNAGYYKCSGREADPGNVFASCQSNCRLYMSIGTTFRNSGADTFSFALAYPSFQYLSSEGDECCACAAGGSSVKLKSVHISLPLGKARLGGATAAISLVSPEVNGELFLPRTLQVQLAPGFSEKRDSTGTLKQVYGPSVMANVTLRAAGDGYEVMIYDRPSGSLPNPATGLIPVGGLTALTTHRFINNQAGPGPWPPGTGELRYEKAHGTTTEVSTFKSEAQTGNGTPLTSLTHPGSTKKESVRTTWEVNASNVRLSVDTETRLTYGAAGSITGKEVRTFRWGTNGRVLDKVVIDPDGVALTTAYTYVTDDPLQVSQVVRPDGSWDQYTYDALRRVTKHRSGRLDTPLTCTDAECRVETTTWPSVMGSGITRVVTTDANVEVARRYRQDLSDGYKDVVCTVAGAAITASTNLVTTTKWYISGLFQRRPRLVTADDGTLTKYTYSFSVTAPNTELPDADTMTTVVESGAPNGASDAVVDGTRSTRVINREGQVILELTEDILSAETLASRLASSVDAHGRPVTWSHQDGSQEILNYDCCGLSSRTDRQGVVTNYSRDKVVSRVPAGGGAAVNGLESSTGQSVSYLNGAGALQTGNLEYLQRDEGLASRTFRKGADGTLIETGRTVRDAAGRVLSSRDALGNVTAFAEQYVTVAGGKHLVRTTTLPGGGTRLEEYYQDGSLKSVTGTAVHGQRYDYGVDASGTWTKVILLLANGNDSGEWSQSWTDMAGRAWKTQTSAGAVTTRYFNTIGQLVKTVDPDGVTALSQYDSRGRLKRTILDVNRNSTVELAGPDSISETVSSISTHGGTDVHLTTTSVWTTTDTGATGSEVARSEVGTTGLESWSTAAGITSHTVRTLPAGGAWTETTTAPDNTQTLAIYSGGRLTTTARKDTAGATLSNSTMRYDAHGRIHSTVDPRGGVTAYTYYDDDSVSTVTSPDPDGAGPLSAQVTSTTYTVRGQTDVVTLPDGRTSDSDYYLTGEVFQVTGTAAPAVAYTYDYAGRALTLTTQPGTGAAAVTAWSYHSTTGRLLSKAHAANSGTESYTWSAGGRAITKTNARGNVTGYFYGSATLGTVAGAGDLTDVTYTDATPAIAYTFDRLGRMNTATRGGITRTVSLTLHGQQESESRTGGPLDGLAVDPGYDALRRRNSLAVSGSGGTVPAVSYGYDALTGEPALIASGTASAAYTRRTGTRQIESVTFADSSTTRLTQTRTYDDLHRLTGVTSQNGAPLAASGYTLDVSGRRARTVLADGTWWQYTYDTHGQVTAAERRRTAGAAPDDSDPAIPGQQFGYAYDGLGNRTAATQGGGGATADAALTYTPATSNQYSTVANNRTGIATGSAAPAASVTVNASAAPREGPWWGQSKTTTAGSSAAWLDFSIDATLGGNTDHADTSLLAPPSSVSPTYDADGNLTDDGLRTLTWDADSRLTSVTTKDTLLPAGAPMYRVSYQYDDGGRRIAQTVEARTFSGGVYVLASRRCFLYDGWNCVAEYDYAPSGGGASRTLFRSFVWSSSSPSSSLLIVRRHTGPQAGTHFATHDGNGNVTALVDASSGTESARYDYDPFGNLLRATGPFAAENPFRFSSQFTDEVTGLVYYGYRHYDPVAGRWLSRDPIGERGGVNLYGFIGNDGVNGVDMLGLSFWGWVSGEEGWIPGYDTAAIAEAGWDGAKQGAQNVADAYTGVTKTLNETGRWWGDRIGHALYNEAAWEQDKAAVVGGAKMVAEFWGNYATNPALRDDVNSMLGEVAAQSIREILSDPDKASKFFAGLSATAAFAAVGARGETVLLDSAGKVVMTLRISLAELRAIERAARSVPTRAVPECRPNTTNPTWTESTGGQALKIDVDRPDGKTAAKTPLASLPKPSVPTTGPMPAEMGKLLRLGTGSDVPRQQIGTLTREFLEQGGVTREVAEQWRNVYQWQVQNLPKNGSAAGRLDLMNHIMEVLK